MSAAAKLHFNQESFRQAKPNENLVLNLRHGSVYAMAQVFSSLVIYIYIYNFHEFGVFPWNNKESAQNQCNSRIWGVLVNSSFSRKNIPIHKNNLSARRLANWPSLVWFAETTADSRSREAQSNLLQSASSKPTRTRTAWFG